MKKTKETNTGGNSPSKFWIWCQAFSTRLFLSSLVTIGIVFILANTGVITISEKTMLAFLFTTIVLVGFFNRKRISSFVRKDFTFFLFLSGFLIASILFVLLFTLISYESPLIYEDSQHSRNQLSFNSFTIENTSFSTDYNAELDYLGTVHLQFEPKTSDQLDAHGVVAKSEESRMHFSIAEKGKDPFYESEHTVYWVGSDSFSYPFGFPQQEESGGKIYSISLRSIDDTSSYLKIAHSTDGQLSVRGRYVIDMRTALTKPLDAFNLVSYKYQKTFDEQLPAFIFTIVALTVAFVMLWEKQHSFEILFKKTLALVSAYLIGIQIIGFVVSGQRFPNSFALTGWYLYLLLLILGLTVFFVKRKNISIAINQDIIDEQVEIRERAEVFQDRFSSIQKAPILGEILKNIYAIGWPTFLALMSILSLFIVVKIPNLDSSFSNIAPTKYLLYAGAAKAMYERNDPLFHQIPYNVDPVHNPQGIYNYFSNPPLNEWGILATYYLFPSNSFEVNTHLFTLSLGILMLVLAFIFFKKWFTKTETLIIIFLLCINPIINWISFIPIEDSWLVIFTFLSLIYVSNYIKSDKVSDLFLTAAFFGMGNANKPSIFLWLFPMLTIFLFSYRKNNIRFIRDVTTIGLIALLSIVAYNTSLRFLPENAIISSLKFLMWLGGFSAIFYLLKTQTPKIENLINYIFRNKLVLVLSAVTFGVLGYIFLFHVTNLKNLSGLFLTNSYLLFNWDMYKQMFFSQYKMYMTPSVFWLGILSFVIVAFLKVKQQKVVLLAFIGGSISYWVLASQSIWFHNYYTHVFMITFAIAIAIAIHALARSLPKHLFFATFLIVTALLIFPTSYAINKNRGYQSYRGYIEELVDYLKRNTKEDSIYVTERWEFRYLTFYSNRAQMYAWKLATPEIVDSIRIKGVEETMADYNISYLITWNEKPNYILYTGLFSPSEESIRNNTEPVITDRTERILRATGKKIPENVQNTRNIEDVTKFDIPSIFTLEKEFGPFKLFRLTD